MKLLLHICCAPCLIYPLERLRQEGFQVSGIFYNPNIHPPAEYKKRGQAVVDFAKSNHLEIIYPEYKPQEYFQAVNFKEDNPQRCSLCWALRLKATARVAKSEGFKYFSTTLLVSPYQDQRLLNKIGSDISEDVGVDFYDDDFRPGFRKAHQQAHLQGIYCQKYCGCIYSLENRDRSIFRDRSLWDQSLGTCP